jgi:hypothetical protein
MPTLLADDVASLDTDDVIVIPRYDPFHFASLVNGLADHKRPVITSTPPQ